MLSKLKLKYIQTLGQKKFRQEERLFIAEGPKLVQELLEEKKASVREVWALPGWIEEYKSLVGTTVVGEISEVELERISQLNTPNKVLAIVEQFELPDTIETKGKVSLVLDTIQDPGNLGTIIRIADWFGIEQIVCSEESADLYNTKVVQSTMGSIARVKVFYRNLGEWLSKQEGITLYATALNGQDITRMERITEGLVIIGNESKGISPVIMDLANVKITIPQKGKAESLNAAVAAGIILSHIC